MRDSLTDIWPNCNSHIFTIYYSSSDTNSFISLEPVSSRPYPNRTPPKFMFPTSTLSKFTNSPQSLSSESDDLNLNTQKSSMQKAAQTWFSGGPSEHPQRSTSLLADWNSYAEAQDDAAAIADPGFDIEAAVRTANDKVSGTFNIFSKGVRDLPGSFSSTSSIPSGKSLMYFGLFLASGVFFIFIAFTMFLPVMVLMPQKFAICFTMGCGFIIGSFFALKGPSNQLAHMTSKERLPFTLGFLGTMVGTVYVSMVLHSYILSVIFSVLQVLALSYYAISYFPGGSAGLKFLSSTLTSSILRCFGR